MFISFINSIDWVSVLTGAGFGSGVAIILLHQLIKEKQSDRLRISKLEDFQQITLLAMIKEQATANQKLMDVIQDNTDLQKQTQTAMKHYQRMVEDSHKLTLEATKALQRITHQ